MNLTGNLISTYCPDLTMTPYTKYRLREVHQSIKQSKCFHEDRWIKRALKSEIIEESGNIVVAREARGETLTAYVIDLSTCVILTVFYYKPRRKYLNLIEGATIML